MSIIKLLMVLVNGLFVQKLTIDILAMPVCFTPVIVLKVLTLL